MTDPVPYPWRRALLLAAATVYGPFVLMALVAQSMLSCDHCRVTAWKALPAGPAMLGMDLLARAAHVAQMPDALRFGLSATASCLVVFGTAYLARGTIKSRVTCYTVVAVWSSFMAMATLAVIRV